MKILNLFAGIGGNRTLWGDKHEIIAVEHDQRIAMIYLKRFPKDTVIVGDAMEYNLWNYDKFDFIWASPPCPTHSQANNFLHAQGVRRYPDMNLWQLIFYLRRYCEYAGKHIYWIVENPKIAYVEDSDIMLKPNFILGRHWFWSNITIPDQKYEFSSISVINTRASTRRSNRQYYEDLCKEHHVDIDFIDQLGFSNWDNHDLKGQVLRNCVKPEIGKYILDTITSKKQLTLEVFK